MICPGLGAGCLPPVLGQVREGVAPSLHEGPGVLPPGKMDILRKKYFRAYLQDISRYSHFNAQKHETIGQNNGGTFDSPCCPQPNYWGDMPHPGL